METSESTHTSDIIPIKVFILTDGQGWIVDRITDEMVKRMPFDFIVADYTKISKEDFIRQANEADLVHYQNWDCERLLDCFDQIKKPIIMTIRSFRFPEYIHKLKGKVYFHIINPKQKEFFPDATLIPDGIFGEFKKDFTVGFAGRCDEYKGFPLIKQSCDELGVSFKPADVKPEEMGAYYDSIDLYCCASLNEGHSTPVMECLARNKPVITTDVGVPSLFDIDKVERSVEGIKKGILRHYTYPLVKDYSWENICNKLTKMYENKCRRG